MSTPMVIELIMRGQLVYVDDIEAWDDRSVGIPWHVDNYSLTDAEGRKLDWTLTEQEEQQLADAVWNQEMDDVWYEMGQDEDGSLSSREMLHNCVRGPT